jgi:hypothetical protein
MSRNNLKIREKKDGDNIIEVDIWPVEFENCETTLDMSVRTLFDICNEFKERGFAVSSDAVTHNYHAWLRDEKSGFKDEENDTFVFTPCGCNPLRFTASHLTGSDWEKTYSA